MASVRSPAPVSPIDVPWLAEEGAVLGCSSGTPRRPLIVGGSGLVGSNLLVLLASTRVCEQIRVLDVRPPAEGLLASISVRVDFVEHRLGTDSYEAVLAAMDGVDCVFSVVTPHVQLASERDFYLTNVDGVRHLVRACAERGVRRIVHLSSSAVTSHFHESMNQPETHPLPAMEDYRTPYDATKRMGEAAVLEANGKNGVAACCLRASGVFLSPWDFAFRNMWPLIPGIIAQPMGKKIDFIDGRDVVRALLMVAQALEERPDGVAGEVFFASKGEAWSPGEVSQLTAKLLGYPFLEIPLFVIEIVRALAFVYHHARRALGLRVPGVAPHRFMQMLHFEQTFDNSKIERVVGFRPKVLIKDCIARIVELYVREVGARRGPRLPYTLLRSSAVLLLAGLAVWARCLP